MGLVVQIKIQRINNYGTRTEKRHQEGQNWCSTMLKTSKTYPPCADFQTISQITKVQFNVSEDNFPCHPRQICVHGSHIPTKTFDPHWHNWSPDGPKWDHTGSKFAHPGSFGPKCDHTCARHFLHGSGLGGIRNSFSGPLGDAKRIIYIYIYIYIYTDQYKK